MRKPATASKEELRDIVTQVVENIQRSALTEADKVDAYHQLSLIDVSAAQIAKKSGRTKSNVDVLSSRQAVRVFQELRLRRRPAEDAMKEFLDCL